MIDRYAKDALACYGRLRRLDPAAARAELELLNRVLAIDERVSGTRAARPGLAGRLRNRRSFSALSR